MPEETTEGPELDVTPDVFSREEMSKVRNEAKNYRLKLRESERLIEDLNAKVTKFEETTKSEVEKLTERATAAERALADKDREIAEARIQSKVVAEAAKMGFANPQVAFQLIDLSTIDEEDSKSISGALGNLVKSEPYLIASTPPTPGVGGPPVSGSKTPDDQMAEIMRNAVRRKQM